MELYYYKLFNPSFNNDNNNILLNNIDKNKDIYSIESFYIKYKYFNIDEFKILNKNYLIKKNLLNMKNIDFMVYYHLNNKNNILLSSIKDFYIKYPDFDLFLYKKIYNELNFKNNIDYLIHYHNIGINQNKICSINYFKKKYNIDINFIKSFYNYFENYSEIDIIKILLKNINNEKYIVSEKIFNKRFPDFNIKIYKLFNNNDIIDDIKCKSYWFHNDIILDKIYSINSFLKQYSDFNLTLYCTIYNINKIDEISLDYWYHNKNKLIYSYKSFINIIDDFNFISFINDNIRFKKNKYSDIILFYINNINKIKNIYSYKYFLIKYPNFNIIEYLNFNKVNFTEDLSLLFKDINKNKNNISKNNKIINILNEYHNLEYKDNIIISIEDFYNKNKSFNLNLYKGILKNNNLIFNNDDEYLYYYQHNTNNNENYYNKLSSIDNFYNKYSDFNINLYKYFNNIKNNDIIDIFIDFDYKIKLNTNIIYSINTFYNSFKNFNKNIYKVYNNLDIYFEDELIIHFHNIGLNMNLVYNEDTFISKYNDFNIKIYKIFNTNLEKITNSELIIHWINNKDIKKIYSVKSFYEIYPNIEFKFEFNHCNNIFLNLSEENKIIYWANNIFLKNKDINIYKNNIIGHQIVNNISEVLFDLENIDKNNLEKGISLIIRAKNEEDNIKNCIESVIDLVDEIVFVDNNSTDKTYQLVEEYQKFYDKIKLYKYNINVTKAGIEHTNIIKTLNKNTLGTFYNWCLSKATKYNIFKWDADFICIKNNFIQLVNIYDLKNREDKFAIWFTGKTLFENNNIYYINDNSFYNEYRIFSYKNDFKWYDGNICEFTDPYLEKCNSEKKYKYIYPLFYEVKRTSIDEFKERSSLIDSRDINDHKILNLLKNNDTFDLININNNILFYDKKILLYTPSFSFGGGNQIIINLYNVLKSFGFNIKIIPLNNENIDYSKFSNIISEDIIKLPTIDFINNYKPNFIFLNSILPFDKNDINILIKNEVKIIFITHSDVAYSNYFIKNNHNIFYKILTVNNYTITKLSKILNIKENKFYKISNYTNIIENNNINKNKTKKFGVISRFSEDKNIPMLIISLVEIFNKYPDYKCYLIGTHNNKYDNYLKYLCKIYNLNKNIIFTGFQNNVVEYYILFDFIILPSVSEGCPYNIIEALGLGIPVITSNVGGNHELIKNNINGILYNYTGIRDYEKNTVYICNYNEQLSLIGYYINDNNFNKFHKNSCEYTDTEVILPMFVNCKNCSIYNKNCSICNYKNKKNEIFNENIKNITNSIINMIEMNNDNIKLIKKNNIKFFNDNFNKKLYINQLLEIINY
jgi:glycosyltransferase involved in cell wall biosynthesis